MTYAPRLTEYRSLARKSTSEQTARNAARRAHEAGLGLIFTPIYSGGSWLVVAEDRFGAQHGYLRA